MFLAKVAAGRDQAEFGEWHALKMRTARISRGCLDLRCSEFQRWFDMFDGVVPNYFLWF